MKFTEGGWLRSERSNAYFASQVYDVYATDDGMKVVCFTDYKKNRGRGDTIGKPTITIEFSVAGENTIRVKSYHFEGEMIKKPSFDLNIKKCKFDFIRTENEAILKTGDLSVKVDLDRFSYEFIANGKMLSSTGFRNLGYIRWNKKPSSMLPGDDYFMEKEYTPYMVNELSLSPNEYVYGLGERFTNFTKNGQTVEIWNEDGGTSTQVSYKNIPFYITNKNYGVFVNSTDKVSFEVASEKVSYVGFSVEGETLDYFFFYGEDAKKIIKSYTTLTGKPALPPAWSFGLWLSTSFTTNYDENTVKEIIDGMEKRDIPLSVFHFDCFWLREMHLCDFTWDTGIFPDVQGMLKRYHGKGLKICVWINPYVAQNTEMFTEGREKGYFLMRADGKGVWQTDNWQAGMAIVDFTNPEAYAWFQEKIKFLNDLGVDAVKTDFGERIPVDVKYYDGSDAKSMHNYYTYLYNKCVFDALNKNTGEPVVFSRSATVGSQKFPVHWGGDCSASYSSMAETLRGGLSFAMSGFSFWSHDIGGFERTASGDVYKRWLAFGLLSSHSRLHGGSSYRVPWAFDEESCLVAQKFAKLKCKLMPYLYAKAIEAEENGTPLLRPMIMEYYDDIACQTLDMQYMLGDKLLVAPIFNKEGTATYYLPKGKWVDYFTGRTKDGKSFYTETYDFLSLPLYVKENTLLVTGTVENRPDYDYQDNFVLEYYLPKTDESATAFVPTLDGKQTEVTVKFDGKKVIANSDLELNGVAIKIVWDGKVKESVLKKDGGAYIAE